MIQPILRKCSLTHCNFILEQQAKSHIKVEVFSKNIEVAEVETVASGCRQSGQGPGEKKIDQKF